MNCFSEIPIRAKKFCTRECAFKFRKNANHHAWLGDNASYSAIHKWASSHFEKPNKCFYCEGSKPRIEWANISGQYKRDQSDWVALCSSCHRYFDRNLNYRLKIKKVLDGQT